MNQQMEQEIKKLLTFRQEGNRLIFHKKQERSFYVLFSTLLCLLFTAGLIWLMRWLYLNDPNDRTGIFILGLLATVSLIVALLSLFNHFTITITPDQLLLKKVPFNRKISLKEGDKIAVRLVYGEKKKNSHRRRMRVALYVERKKGRRVWLLQRRIRYNQAIFNYIAQTAHEKLNIPYVTDTRNPYTWKEFN